jgi:hypothetical protein
MPSQITIYRTLKEGALSHPEWIRQAIELFAAVWLRKISKVIEPSVADGGFQSLSQSHHLLMHGAVGRRLAALRHRFFVAVNPD